MTIMLISPVSLSPALSVGSYTHQYYSQGYLIYQHQGQAGKVSRCCQCWGDPRCAGLR